jgi:hypothetical protein
MPGTWTGWNRNVFVMENFKPIISRSPGLQDKIFDVSYPSPVKENRRDNIMSSDPSTPQRLRLQVVIATESPEGQIMDLRKFLHITQKEKDVSVLASEVTEKFGNLYPAERYILYFQKINIDLLRY